MKTVNYFENGRSMVEMLAILAVIGVISIATITLYNVLVSKFRAKNVSDVIHEAHVQMAVGKIPTFAPIEGISFSTVNFNVGGEEKADGAIKVDFKDDSTLCKQFKSMYEKDPNFAIIGTCDD